MRLFQRSTRKLTLTEAGEQLLASMKGHLKGIQFAIADVARDDEEPAGVLKVSMSLSFGMDYLLLLLPDFLARYPRIQIDSDLENRQVDLIAEGFDAAIGGGIELFPELWDLVFPILPQICRYRLPKSRHRLDDFRAVHARTILGGLHHGSDQERLV